MDRDNRKSHLAPQLSPATQELLRGSDSPTQTPTQGEIPVIVLTSTPHDIPGSPSNGSPIRERHSSVGRAGGPPVHPRLGSRVVSASTSTTRSISRFGDDGDDEVEYLSPRTRPKTQTTYAPNFSLPIRSCPPVRRRPPEVRPQPQRQSVPADDEEWKENRRRGFVDSGPTPTRKGTI